MKSGMIVDKLKKIHWCFYLLLIIALGVLRLFLVFSERDGHHVDETWSYGFANSYYDPYIYTDNRSGIINGPEGVKNIRSWIKGDVFSDYLMVGDDNTFSFDSVIYNKQEDLGPALFEILLHFICSFFPGTFSWWYAFFLNILLLIITLIFVYLIGYEFTNSYICGSLCAIYYIFSGCGTSTFLYLRVYSLFTCLTVTLFYFIVKIIKYKTKGFNYLFLILPVFELLGCLTHYYFLVISFLFTLFGAILLLIKRRFTDSFRLCYVMLFSVMAFFAMYFQCVHMLLPFSTGEASVGGYSFPYWWELATANMHFFMGTIGFYINFSVPLLLTVFGIVIFGGCITALIIFLFRNEKWMKNLLTKSRKGLGTVFHSFLDLLRCMDSTIYIALLVSVIYIFILPMSASLVSMGFVERYFAPGMTIFIIMIVSVLAKILVKTQGSAKRRVIKSVLLVALMVFLNIRSNLLTEGFKFTDSKEQMLRGYLNGSDVYVVTDNIARDMTWMSSVLYMSDDVYIDNTSYIENEGFADPAIPDDCYIILNSRGFLDDNDVNAKEVVTITLAHPHLMKTSEEFMNMIGETYSGSFEYVDEYDTFIGDLKLYHYNAE